MSDSCPRVRRVLLILSHGFALAVLLAGRAVPAGEPLPNSVVLDFTAEWCGPCKQMGATVRKLEQQGYAIRKVDVDQQPNLARSFGIRSIPTFVLVIDGEERTRMTGVVSEDQLRRLAQQVVDHQKATAPPARESIPLPKSPESGDDAPSVSLGQPAQETPKATSKEPARRPGLFGKSKLPSLFPRSEKAAVADHHGQSPAVIRGQGNDAEGSGPAGKNSPLAASVRLRVTDASGANFGSGTIIDSRVGRTTIITCGHLFRPLPGTETAAGVVKTVEVDIFLTGDRPETYVGKIVDFDLEGDVGVVTINTTGVLPFVPVAPLAESPSVQTAVISIGCGGGEHPSKEAVRVTALNRYDGPENIECTGVPVQGRSGGGLFDRHGQLVGVCILADQEGHRGVYAGLKPIYHVLTRAGFQQIVPPVPPEKPAMDLQDDELAGVLAQSSAPPDGTTDQTALPEQPFGDSLPGWLDGRGVPTTAEVAELFSEAPDAEVICIVRPKNGAANRVVILNQASTRFVSYLLDSMDGPPGALPRNASLRIDDPRVGPDETPAAALAAVGVPRRAAELQATPAARPSSRSRFGSRSAK